jgi:hypothetical protein
MKNSTAKAAPQVTVDAFIKNLKHPLKAEVEALRAIILGADNQLLEHIKWNAPSYCFNGEDRVTFNLHAQDKVQLVFHRGPKSKEDSKVKFTDSTGLLKWVAADRAIATFHNLKEVQASKSALKKVVREWIKV